MEGNYLNIFKEYIENEDMDGFINFFGKICNFNKYEILKYFIYMIFINIKKNYNINNRI